MDYIEVTCRFAFSREKADIIISALASIGFDGFIEENDQILAYIPVDDFNPTLFDTPGFQATVPGKVHFYSKTIKEQNWNQVWESSYAPVIINNICVVRAPFHAPVEGVLFDIVIEPKMSFGTAHHETTALMIEYLFKQEIKGKSVLDMGCGTGVLAILAAKMGADKVTAIDNDEWAYANTLENMGKNNITHCSVYLGDASGIENDTFDLILANINRNILVNDMTMYAKGLHLNGTLIMSGFFRDDVQLIAHTARNFRLEMSDSSHKGEWAAVRFQKKNPVN